MKALGLRIQDGVATLTLQRGKVNALDEALVTELGDRIRELEEDDGVRVVVLTGAGKFFSFGFDIPEFLSYSQKDFARFLTRFTDLYTRLYVFPKPLIGALNGHTIAGGCMLALTCDARIMATGKGKISLNEISFGSSVFAGSIEMLVSLVGQRRAESIVVSGAMYDAHGALDLGLVDRICEPDQLRETVVALAEGYAEKDPVAFRSIKSLLRGPVAARMQEREAASIREFADIWYSERTWRNLEKIRIRSE